MSTKFFRQIFNLFFVFALMVGLLLPASSTSALTQNAAPAVVLPPNDEKYGLQWNLDGTYGINASAAWEIETGSESTVVAVLDTGILGHEDFDGSILINNGYDFVSNVANDNDDGLDGDLKGRDPIVYDPGDYGACGNGESTWQGTHVAGIIGAASDNTTGITGINWNTQILPVRVIGTCNSADPVDIVDGMKWAAGLTVSGAPANANPAKVIQVSASLAGQACDPYQADINAIIGTGAVIVAAAGDNNANVVNFPSNCAGVITVAATDKNGMRASYSRYGTAVEISAPGGGDEPDNILSTTNTGSQGPAQGGSFYEGMKGTAMAAAHVSGVVSLMFAVDPTLTPAKVLEILQATASDFPTGTGACTTSDCGSGIVNAGSALEGVQFTLRPDLVITNVALSRYYPSFGEKFQIDITVKNQGRTGTESSVYVQVYVDTPPAMVDGCPVNAFGQFGTNTETAGPLGDGDTETISIIINNPSTPSKWQWTADAPIAWGDGTHKLYVYVDGNCIVPEVDEGNNLYSASNPPEINSIEEGALVYPRNDIGTDYNPTYKWNKVTGATSYRLYVSKGSTKLIDQWFRSDLVCDENASTCAVSPGLTPTLAGGDYTWSMQPRNPAGYGDWSAKVTFSTLGKPGIVTDLLYPAGDIESDYTPTFRWQAVEGATSYEIYLTDPNGKLILRQWYQSLDHCSGGTCTVEYPLRVAAGSHKWSLRTFNPAGYGDWSSKITFTTSKSKPNIVTDLLYPVGGIERDYTPTFRWQAVEGATSYEIYLTDPNGKLILNKWYQAVDYCTGGTCAVEKPLRVAAGSHKWSLRTFNPAGYGDWSAKVTFSTLGKPGIVTDLLYPAGDIESDYTPTFRWQAVEGATSYEIYLTDPNGKLILRQWYQSLDHCSGGTCTVEYPLRVAAGSHKWSLRTFNPAGYGDWSSKVTFTTSKSKPNIVTDLLYPVGGIESDYTPTFRWQAVEGATSYEIYLTDPNGKLILNKWYQAVDYCTGGTCTVEKPLRVAAGSHKWSLRTFNPAGYGDWSAKVTFSTDSVVPQPVNFDDPDTDPENGQNLATNYNHTFTWKKVDEATSYLLLVKGPTGTIINTWFPSDSYCSGDDICRVPYSVHQVTLRGGLHTWQVRSWNPAGYGNWSNVNSFSTIPQAIPAASTPFINGLPNESPKNQPLYVWSRVPMATSYRLYVKGPRFVVLDEWHKAVDVCGKDYCSIPNLGTLGDGEYTWWVQTYNPAGYGPWRSQHFSVKSALAASTGLSVSGAANEPVYQWNKVSSATQYHLYVTGPDYVLDKWIICSTDVCSLTTSSISVLSKAGTYSWSVMPYNSTAGYGLWTASETFTYSP